MFAALFVLLQALDPAAAASATTPAGPEISEERLYYDLHSSSLRALRREMRERKGIAGIDGKSLGLTRQNLETSFELTPVEGGCRLTALSVKLSITIHLPRWTPPKPPASFLQERWDSMIAGLTLHEEGHRDNAVETATGLHRELSNLGLMTSCLELERAARRASFQAQVGYRLRDRHYDRRTRHGELQGSAL